MKRSIGLITLNAKFIHSSLSLRYLRNASRNAGYQNVWIREFVINQPIWKIAAEIQKLKPIIKDFHNEFPEAFIYVIDNNSNDNTNKIAHETYKELSCNGEVLFVKEQGKANAMRYAHSYM